MTRKCYIVWNEALNEGIIMSDSITPLTEDEIRLGIRPAKEEAEALAAGVSIPLQSSLAIQMREFYDEDVLRIEEVELPDLV